MLRLLGALAALVLTVASPAFADKYPSRLVRIVVPYAPGSATDIVARLVSERLQETLGQAFIVENKPGAFGILAIEEVARSQPDGYTLLIGNVSTSAITPFLYKDRMRFDYEKTITPVARLGTIPAILAASTTSNIKIGSLSELVEYGRKNPGKLNYSSAGIGSYPHFDAAIFAKRAGFESVHVPTKSGAPGMMTDMMTGAVHWGFLNAASSLGLARDGQLMPLAVVSEKRLPELPNVPTLAELGYPGVGTMQWQALSAPAGVPSAILQTLHDAVVEAMASPKVKSTFEKSTIIASPTKSPEDAKAWMQGEIAFWKKTIAESGINLN